jgi:hypothetical protein
VGPLSVAASTYPRFVSFRVSPRGQRLVGGDWRFDDGADQNPGGGQRWAEDGQSMSSGAHVAPRGISDGALAVKYEFAGAGKDFARWSRSTP